MFRPTFPGCVVAVLLALPLRAGMLSYDHAKPTDPQVRIAPSKTAALAFLEVVDPKTGRVLKTLFAGSITPGNQYPIQRGRKLPTGSYTLRYREGITIQFDSAIPAGKSGQWTNPVDVIVADKGVYVWDSGRPLPKRVKDSAAPAPPTEVEAATESRACVFKFTRDGKPDATFGDRGRSEPFAGPKSDPHASRLYNLIHAIAVDPEGRVYIGSTYHEVVILDPSGQRLAQTVGGWDNDPHGPKCTGWVNSLAAGAKNRLYLPSGYGNMKVYDTTKEKLEGALYSCKLPGLIGPDRCVASDPPFVYVINSGGTIGRFRDTGSAIEADDVWSSSGAKKMINPCGIGCAGGLIWVASHGGPPLWDSDGGEIFLFWDNGGEIEYIDRWGRPGKAADKLEFLNPSAVAMTPDHKELWVTEDGGINDEGPPGNARVRKFKVGSVLTEELPLEIAN